MGCLEIVNSGYGFKFCYNSNEFTSFSWDKVLPKDLSKYNVPEDVTEGWQKACYVGRTAEYVYTDVDSVINFDDADKYEIQRMLLGALGKCFEVMHGMPFDTIRCVEDYNGDCMFYLVVRWPLEEKNEYLANLTKKSFLDDINDYLRIVIGAPEVNYSELAWCEEYNKW